MKNKIKLFGIIALIAIIGFSFVALSLTGCGDGSGGGGTTTVPVTGVTLNQNSLSLTVGGTTNLTATVAPENATNKTVTWSSSDTAKATVSKGVVTAVAKGTATITVTTADRGKTDTCTVTVTDGGTDDKTPITVAEISITAPVNGGTPATSVNGDEDERFTAGTVTWSPNDNPFKPNTEYTATVTLTAKSDLTFTGLNANNAKINGSVASLSSNTGETVTLSHKFPATSTKIVTSIAIKSSPDKMSYTHGEKLDLSGMVVTLTYNEGAPEDVAPTNFEANGITATPAEGDHLVHTTHNNNPITIKHGSLTSLTTGNLTVAVINVNDLTIEPNSIPAATYTGSDIEPAITVKHPVVGSTRTLEKGTDYTVSYSNNRNAGTATITITGKGDYTGSRDVEFTINKAAGVAVNAPTLSSTGDLGNNQGSATINAVTINGQSVEYGISTTNDASTVVEWQDGLTFNNLTIGLIDYQFIFARSKGDNNHHAGAASAGLSVTIPMVFEGTSTEPLGNLLVSLPKNTPATPYIIKLNMSMFVDQTTMTSEVQRLIMNPTKYVYLDLSDSTFTSMRASAFSGASTLTGITLPDSVTSIGNTAFQGCTSLTNVTIPKSVTSIGNSAFVECSSLIAINVDANNSTYSSQDGVLYNKTKTSLIWYPQGKTNTTFTIPDSVTSLENGAFMYSNLTSVIIPNSVTSIGLATFRLCANLTSVRFERTGTTFNSTTSPSFIDAANTTSLQTAYTAGGIGTYTRPDTSSTTWTKISD